MLEMTPLELDALGEIFNISVGRAAASLSELTREVVSMSVPLVHIISPHKAVELLDPDNRLRITSVSQQFSGSFSGKALLMFPGSNSLEVVRVLASVIGFALILRFTAPPNSQVLASIRRSMKGNSLPTKLIMNSTMSKCWGNGLFSSVAIARLSAPIAV